MEVGRKKYTVFILLIICVWAVFLLKPLSWNSFSDGHTDEIKTNKTDNKGTNESNKISIPLGVFDENNSWNTESDWKGTGIDVYSGKIDNDIFTIENGTKFAHYAKKFMDPNFQDVKIVVDIYDNENTSIKLKVATSGLSAKEDMAKLDFNSNKISDKKIFDLEEGLNKVDLNKINWDELGFFKILLYRGSEDLKSPRIKSVETN